MLSKEQMKKMKGGGGYINCYTFEGPYECSDGDYYACTSGCVQTYGGECMGCDYDG